MWVRLIDKLKQRINDSQNEMDKLEDDYNKANIVIETLENQRISLVEKAWGIAIITKAIVKKRKKMYIAYGK